MVMGTSWWLNTEGTARQSQTWWQNHQRLMFILRCLLLRRCLIINCVADRRHRSHNGEHWSILLAFCVMLFGEHLLASAQTLNDNSVSRWRRLLKYIDHLDGELCSLKLWFFAYSVRRLTSIVFYKHRSREWHVHRYILAQLARSLRAENRKIHYPIETFWLNSFPYW